MNLENTGQPPACSFDGPAQEKLGGKVLGDGDDNLNNENKTSSRGHDQAQLCTLDVLGNVSLAPDSVTFPSVLLSQDIQVAIPGLHLLPLSLSPFLPAPLISTVSAPW